MKKEKLKTVLTLLIVTVIGIVIAEILLFYITPYFSHERASVGNSIPLSEKINTSYDGNILFFPPKEGYVVDYTETFNFYFTFWMDHFAKLEIDAVNFSSNNVDQKNKYYFVDYPLRGQHTVYIDKVAPKKIDQSMEKLLVPLKVHLDNFWIKSNYTVKGWSPTLDFYLGDLRLKIKLTDLQTAEVYTEEIVLPVHWSNIG